MQLEAQNPGTGARPRRPGAWRLWALLPAVLAAACSSSLLPESMRRTPAQGTGTSVSRAAVSQGDAQLVADYLALMDSLAKAAPAAQAEIAEAAKRAVSVEPTTANRLRWAFILALPGHGRTDASAARTVLGEVLAAPEQLLPGERALAGIILRDVNARLALTSETQALRQTATSATTDRDRTSTLARRAQADLEAQKAENERLKKELEEAKAKLAAVAELERSMQGRQKPNP